MRIAERLLGGQEDLIHKAVGRMLHEVGKRERSVLEAFLRRHGKFIPRIALHYAIERFPTELRLAYVKGTAWK
jgi:3-methyladenine DNA glycosylase AlkD